MKFQPPAASRAAAGHPRRHRWILSACRIVRAGSFGLIGWAALPASSGGGDAPLPLRPHWVVEVPVHEVAPPAEPLMPSEDDLASVSHALSQALRQPAACVDPALGLHQALAADARLAAGGSVVKGAPAVAELLCAIWGDTVGWGAKLRLTAEGPCQIEAAHEGSREGSQTVEAAEATSATEGRAACGVTLLASAGSSSRRTAATRRAGEDRIGHGFAVVATEQGWRFVGDL